MPTKTIIRKKIYFPFERLPLSGIPFNPVGMNEAWKLLYCSKLTSLLCPLLELTGLAELVSAGHV